MVACSEHLHGSIEGLSSKYSTFIGLCHTPAPLRHSVLLPGSGAAVTISFPLEERGKATRFIAILHTNMDVMNNNLIISQSDRHILADGRFNEFIREAEIGGDMPEEVASQITAGLRRRFDHPPVAHLDACMGGVKAWSQESARQLFFYPNDEDMRLNPSLLTLPSPDADSQDHPQVGMLE